MRTRYKALLVIAAIAILILLASRSKASHEFSRSIYYVEYGDTLWDVASAYCPDDMDKREYINEIITLNDLPSAMIYEGQKLVVLRANDE